MERRDRDRYDLNDNRTDYGRYDGYPDHDEHYHSARNLTDQFEQNYRGSTDDRDDYNPRRSYHEGDSGDAYERLSRQEHDFTGDSGYQPNDWDRNRNYPESLSRDRDRFSNYQDDYRSYPGMDRSDRDRSYGQRSNVQQGNIRRGYGISDYEGTSDRFNTLNSNDNRGSGDQQRYNSGSGGGYQSSRFGGGMGESFPSSHHGVPDTTYGLRNFSDNYGTGMGSSYGGSNYGGGTGYSGGHRGGSFGNSTYGTSSGNYGGSGSMGGGTYGGRSSSGRGETSHNSDRGRTEPGGF